MRLPIQKSCTHTGPLWPLDTGCVFRALNLDSHNFSFKVIQKLDVGDEEISFCQFFFPPACYWVATMTQWSSSGRDRSICEVGTQVVPCISQSPEKVSTVKTVPLSPRASESRPNVGQFPHSQCNLLWRRLLHRGALGNLPT